MGVSSLNYNGRLGIAFEERTAYVYNRSGSTLAVGDVVQFDLTDADANYTDPQESTGVSIGLGTANNFLCNVITPTAASATVPGIGGEVTNTTVGQPPAWFAVVVDLLDGSPAGTTPGANDSIVKVMVQGICKVKPASGTQLTYGRHVFPASGVRTGTATLAKNVKSIGIALATSGTNDLLTTCVIDGIYGFGVAPLDAVV